MEFFAHSLPDPDKARWHRLADHLLGASALAGRAGRKFGAARAAALAGLLHDLGKYSLPFQRRLEGSTEQVDHSTAGAVEILRAATGADRGMAEILAYAIAGHHAGLPDRIGGDGSLTDRLKATITPLEAAWQQELAVDATGLLPALNWHPDRERLAFQLAFLGRMVFSALVDGDYRDTEAFYAKAAGVAVDRDWPALPDVAGRLAAALDSHLASLRRRAAATPVRRLRDAILVHVRGQAGNAPGLFTLTVPTGGGKTLASLAFALDHARAHSLDRIVYAIPFTSIIDQTAAIFRDVLGDDVVLEHHSAIEETENRRREAADKLRLAMEDWAAPVVVTTNVQLFESLFAARPSRCRKLHNLARSVIVLDEAQTLPLPLLRPAVAALDELARNYGCSIVLCTATQPALNAPDFEGGFAAGTVRELAPDPAGLASQLRRVQIRRIGELDDDALVAAMAATVQALVIVNSRAHALALHEQACAAGLEGVLHLTTRQYAAHRRRILADVRRRLKDGLTCRLVATSLVEAGVDLDFPAVWRAEAGLDQVAQAAGRCNREGRRKADESIVTVFRPAKFRPPREIAQLAGDFARMARAHDDLLSPAAIRDYFGEVYWRRGATLDAHGILASFRVDARQTDFAYRTVAERFRMIESGLAPVIVATEDPAREAIEQLVRGNAGAGETARRLQTFVVQVPPRARDLLCRNGHVRLVEERRFGDQFAVLASDHLYTPVTGLRWEDAEYLGIEAAII